MGTEQKEAQARSVGRQQLDVGLLEGQVSQDDGDLQHPLGLHVADAVTPRRVEEAVPALLARRTVCKGNGRSASGETGMGIESVYPRLYRFCGFLVKFLGGCSLRLAGEFECVYLERRCSCPRSAP